jgi:hypothetical protein
MNPQSPETGLNLPAPVAGEQVPASPAQQGPESGLEKGVQSMESSPAAVQPTGPAMTVPPLPMVPAVPQSTPADDVATTSNSSTSVVLDDKDLIEKEWVNKAKAIVERTRDDPHKQSEELSGVKAEYIKTNYGKTLKVNT